MQKLQFSSGGSSLFQIAFFTPPLIIAMTWAFCILLGGALLRFAVINAWDSRRQRQKPPCAIRLGEFRV